MSFRSLFRLAADFTREKPRPVTSDKAPKPVGPYSQAFYAGGFLFCSGQIPLKPGESKPVGQDIESQSRQVFDNLGAVLSKEGMGFQHVVKTLVFLTDMGDFARFNKIYELYFGKHCPARSCVEVSALPKSVLVEVELTAFKGL